MEGLHEYLRAFAKDAEAIKTSIMPCDTAPVIWVVGEIDRLEAENERLWADLRQLFYVVAIFRSHCGCEVPHGSEFRCGACRESQQFIKRLPNLPTMDESKRVALDEIRAQAALEEKE